MKASDVYAQSTSILPRGDFKQAFPQVVWARVVCVEEGDMNDPRQKKQRMIEYPGDFGTHVDCSNPLCYNGGVSIVNLLRAMVYSKETHREFSELCQGYEGSPKGRRKIRECGNMFKGTIQVKYSVRPE